MLYYYMVNNIQRGKTEENTATTTKKFKTLITLIYLFFQSTKYDACGSSSVFNRKFCIFIFFFFLLLYDDY